MKKHFGPFLLLSFLFSLSGISQSVGDRLTTIPQHNLSIKGYVGQKTDDILNKRVIAQDWDYLVEPFRHHEETHLWQMEFWGKWMLGAVAAWEYYHDPVLMDHMSKSVAALIETQLPNGYIGNYSPEAQLEQWDIWGRKYVMLGLLRYHDITHDRKALKAARREADYLLSQVGPGKVNIIETGNYHGMASSSVLEPIMMLYNKTHEEKYLNFAKYIVAQWETPEGPQLISKALAGIHVADRFPHPKSWFSPENGQKAYEMMSCYNGLLELYKVTGEKDYLKAVQMTVDDIMKEEINVAGSGSAFECWYHGRDKQTIPTYHMMETCVLVTWMKLNYDLLRVTGDPAYANNIETSWYNALLASTKYDGSEIQMYSPLIGHRGNTARQCGMDINCCSANGPRGYMLIPRYAVMTSQSGEIYINLYAPMTAEVPLPDKSGLKLVQETDYPEGQTILVRIMPEKPEKFTLALRIPSWSITTNIKINGEDIPDIQPGDYKKITRTWNKGDRIEIIPDMRARILTHDRHVAVLRGPVVLARYSEFHDGFVDEAAQLVRQEGVVNLTPCQTKPEGVWMSFTTQARLGTGIRSTDGPPSVIHLCDFGSAGNTWLPDTRYRVWLPMPLDVRVEKK